MSISRHQYKVAFSSMAIAATLICSFFLGTVNAEDLTYTVVGDNVTIQGGSYADAKFDIGKLLNGNLDGSVKATTTQTVDASTADLLGDLLGNNTQVKKTTTTVWQEMLDAQWVTGLDDVEFAPAYIWARENSITTVPFSAARLDRPILRYEFAKMMLAYIQNVERKTLEENMQCDVQKYSDHYLMDSSVRVIAQKACDIGLMGWRSIAGVNQTTTTPLAKFRPYDVMSETEIMIVANRYVPTTIRLTPTNNTRSAVIRFLYSITPQVSE